VGAIADSFGLTSAFIVPLAAYAFIAWFALAARRALIDEISLEPAVSSSPIP
jgi:FHS family L-fucose permease-like MFS transporter